MTFKEYIENLSNTEKIKIWDSAMSTIRNTSKQPLDIWLEIAVELHEKWETKYPLQDDVAELYNEATSKLGW